MSEFMRSSAIILMGLTVMAAGVAGGAIVVTLSGWIGTRNTASQPPLAVIRQLG